ncbi:hypothetical protein LIER_21978 [Lithospermum erythrorhizon]|uniref:Reverse transcriptase domain-containing protein n=1 Tax=Lithospermum erythrorhizon TaxID=34254 RepID=A0AAV3QUH6_LITER
MIHADFGQWLLEPSEISDHFSEFCKDLFSTEQSFSTNVPHFPDYLTPLQMANQLSFLSDPLNDFKIQKSLKSFKLLKTLGPDGVHPIFFHKCWDSIKDSVTQTIHKEFFEPQSIHLINETVLCLIPKVERLENTKQYRPIGLSNTIDKCLTMIIVNRIRPYLNSIINPFQTSFRLGRQGGDNVILVQEALNFFNNKMGKIGFMAIKIEHEKAFDRLHWSFIHYCLKLFGFNDCISNIIMNCVTTSTNSLILNGKSGTPFKPSRGVRQGHYISPYIFILAMEILNLLIDNAKDLSSWEPFTFGRTGHSITHCFFVDDLILFGKATHESAPKIQTILQLFCEWPGQKI